METIGCNIDCLVFVEEIVLPYAAVMVRASIKQTSQGIQLPSVRSATATTQSTVGRLRHVVTQSVHGGWRTHNGNRGRTYCYQCDTSQ